MIEFNGQISEKNQLDRMKKVKKLEKRLFLFGLIFIWAIAIIVCLPLGVLDDFWKEGVICSVFILIVAFLIVKAPPDVYLRFRLSPHIIITDKELSLELRKNGEPVWRKRKLSKVKKVLDCGEVYYIIFKFGDITNSWICQKNNIVNGTIKEFETLFENKIIREATPK